MLACDICGKGRETGDGPHPRSRCYSCETSEKHWRAYIHAQIIENIVENPEIPLSMLDLATVDSVLEVIDSLAPPAVPLYFPNEDGGGLIEIFEVTPLEIEAAPEVKKTKRDRTKKNG